MICSYLPIQAAWIQTDEDMCGHVDVLDSHICILLPTGAGVTKYCMRHALQPNHQVSYITF